MRTHPKLVLTLVTVAVLLGLGTALAVDTTAQAASTTAAITNFQFTPGTTVSVGDSVTWTNNAASTPHTTTSDSALWNSGTLGPGQSFAFTFASAGTFSYHCNIHPQMVGSIVVKAAAATATAVTPTPTTSALTPTPTTAATATPASPIPAVTPPPAVATVRGTAPAAPATGSGADGSRRSGTLIEGGLGLLGLAGAAFAIAIGVRRRRL